MIQVKVSTLSPEKRKKGCGQSDLRRRPLSFSALLPPHEDLSLACDADTQRGVAITAGRDTTLLAWRMEEPDKHLSSLRGHTGTVSAVALLQASANAALGKKEASALAVSGSSDCSLKVWDVLAGRMVKSVYTYNGIKCLAMLDHLLVLTGTDGGKLEAFDLASGRRAFSVRAHEDAVTAVSVSHQGEDVHVVSASREGEIKVWQRRGEEELRCLFASEDVRPADEDQVGKMKKAAKESVPLLVFSTGGPRPLRPLGRLPAWATPPGRLRRRRMQHQGAGLEGRTPAQAAKPRQRGKTL